jgi:hypothetical protein
MEPLPALETREAPFDRVHPRVFLQRAAVLARLAALCAGVGRDVLGVLATHVRRHCRPVHEALAAEHAAVWLVARVRLHVRQQVRLVGKRVAAHLAHVRVGDLGALRLYVYSVGRE